MLSTLITSHPAFGRSAAGSPFKFHVDSLSSGYVTAYGPGLVHGITGEPANFTVATKDAGAGSAVRSGKYPTSVLGMQPPPSLQSTQLPDSAATYVLLRCSAAAATCTSRALLPNPMCVGFVLLMLY